MHKYNRHVPPPVAIQRMLARKSTPTLAPAFDGRTWAGPVKDQKDEGSCTAFSGTSALEWIYRKYFPDRAALVFSPQYTYVKELMAQGDFPQDAGSDGTTLCTTLIVNGCCELDLFPYVNEQIIKPTDKQIQNALQHTMGAWHELKDSQTAWSVLADPVPWPVLIGFTVHESFDPPGADPAWWKTGIMPIPQRHEKVVGGHEVVAVGCDMGATPTLRPEGAPPSFLIQNSWGSDWALGGFFWMPAAILDWYDTDMKIAHTGHPWVQGVSNA